MIDQMRLDCGMMYIAVHSVLRRAADRRCFKYVHDNQEQRRRSPKLFFLMIYSSQVSLSVPGKRPKPQSTLP